MLKQSLNHLGGANTNVSPFLQPANSPTILNGCNVNYKLGAILKDLGYIRVGDAATAAKSITGLYDFQQSSSVQKILRTKNNDAGTNLLLQYNNSGTWTDISVGSTYDAFEDSATEFETFLGYCFIVGYDSTDAVFLPVASLTGTTFSTSTNVGSMAQGKYIKRYRDRLYVANSYSGGTAYPYRVYFSSIPSAGVITWTPATDFLDFDFGADITGIATNWDKLVVFTKRAAWMYDGSNKKQMWDVGTPAHRSIATHNAYMIWANGEGVWLSTGGQPVNIAGPIIEFIRNASNMANSFAVIVDEEYHLYPGGNITVNGTTYSKVELVFNIPTSTWRWREFYSTPTIFARYDNSGSIRQYIGTTGGEVYDKSKYSDSTLYFADEYIDANNTGQPIAADFELAPEYVGVMSLNKTIEKLKAFADRAQGLQLKYRVINRSTRATTPYKPLGMLTQFESEFDVDVEDGVLLQIAGFEYSKNPYFSFYGYEIDIQSKGETLKSSPN